MTELRHGHFTKLSLGIAFLRLWIRLRSGHHAMWLPPGFRGRMEHSWIRSAALWRANSCLVDVLYWVNTWLCGGQVHYLNLSRRSCLIWHLFLSLQISSQDVWKHSMLFVFWESLFLYQLFVWKLTLSLGVLSAAAQIETRPVCGDQETKPRDFWAPCIGGYSLNSQYTHLAACSWPQLGLLFLCCWLPYCWVVFGAIGLKASAETE